MKKQLFLWTSMVCLMVTASPSAQVISKDPSLVGVWRMHNLQTKDAITIVPLTGEVKLDTTKLVPGIFLKIVNEHAEFTNVYISATAISITGYGTFDILPFNKYVEHVEKSYTNSFFNGKDNTLVYQFIGNNYLILSYVNERGGRVWEVWKRAVGENPYAVLSTPQQLSETKTNPIPKGEKDKKGIYMAVDEMPNFSGGQEGLTKYLQTNLHYPQLLVEGKIAKGIVVVRFVVNTKGKAEQIEVLNSLAPLCDEEAVRVIESMPTWTPGKHQGKAVPVYYTLPIRFVP
ncbi:MAG: TonB family protein [Candidatus Symbiothrix sp.]|jgi:TonB family protein|nr:TonB family protein [Candidatus Symbiothrix sp.]